MISINVIGELISGSYGNTPYSRNYEKDIYNQMVELAEQADDAATVEEYNGILAEFAMLTTEDLSNKQFVMPLMGGVQLHRS